MPTGIYDHYKKRISREIRVCVALNCNNTFECKVNSYQKYCCPGHARKGKTYSSFMKDKSYVELYGEEKAQEIIRKKSKLCSRSVKKLWQDPEYRESQLKAIFKGMKLKPNKPEKQLNKFLQKLFSNQWKYVGDGEVSFGGFNPDFININGQKKIIELFGDWWHGEEKTGRTKKEEEQKRINLFARYGYQTLIVWQHELEDTKQLLYKLKEFNQ